MATNTLGTTNADLIAQKALVAFVEMFPFLRKIATDFSSEGAKFNETVIVHEVAAAAAAEFVPATGYAPSNRTMVDIPVKIDKHKHHTYKVGVQEASTSRVDLIQRLANTAAWSIGAAVMADLWALILNAAFANKTVKALGAGGDGFDRKAAIAIGMALSKRSVPDFGRFMLLNADYYGSFCMDTAMLQVLLAGGADAVKTGSLPQIHGFDVMQYATAPDNGEDLVGIAGVSTALALATRIPDDPGQGASNCRISTVTDTDSGLSLQVREWYNADLAEFRRSYTLMYGVAVGQGAGLQRITSK